MQADLPHVIFTRSKKSPGTPKQSDINDAWRLQEEANRKAQERRAARQRKEGYTVEELFRGDAER